MVVAGTMGFKQSLENYSHILAGNKQQTYDLGKLEEKGLSRPRLLHFVQERERTHLTSLWIMYICRSGVEWCFKSHLSTKDDQHGRIMGAENQSLVEQQSSM